MESETRNLVLPSPKSATPSVEPSTSIRSKGPVVVIGANGAGKTRLGTWIEFESPHAELVRRISAQKSLAMPGSAASGAVDQAYMALLYGTAAADMTNPTIMRAHRLNQRWKHKPSTSLLNDFGELLTYLFSEANETNARYVDEVEREPEQRIEPPETKLRATKRVWEKLLPHRSLDIGGGKIEARMVDLSQTSEESYNASEMSDGERVIFYLVGQALSAPEDGVIVVDEPELHLHRSIQARLWDTIESERPDCLFVYLTHNLDFAASRVSATKVWIESYDGEKWDWHEVEEAEGVPEELYLEILGGRKPVLFCEGDKGSLDYFLLQKAYPDFTVALCGTASGVIHATRSFARLEHLHNHACCGIVDRDHREEVEVQRLEDIGVFVLGHSEIENVLLSEGMLRAVADHLHLLGKWPELLEKARARVFSEMAEDRESLVSSLTAAKVEQRLKKFDARVRKAELRTALADLTSSIDVETIYDETAAEVNRVIDERDYAQALRLYNNKGLLGKIEPLFGFARKGMPELVKRLASSREDGAVLFALREELPDIQV